MQEDSEQKQKSSARPRKNVEEVLNDAPELPA